MSFVSPLAAVTLTLVILLGAASASAQSAPGYPPLSPASAEEVTLPPGLFAPAMLAADPPAVSPPAASVDPQEGKPPTPLHTGIRALLDHVGGDFRHLPSRENLGWTIFGSALALSVHPVDAKINAHLAGKSAVHHFFLPGKVIGEGYIQVGASLATYAYGRLRDEPRVSHVGMDLLRAQILVGALTYALKLSVRRERPDGSNNQSFPSGHASVTFATALVLQRHFGWWSVPTFLVASYTAASRLHENRHYLSDVVAGAAAGVIAGRTVSRHGRTSFALVPSVGRGEVALLLVR